MIPFISLPDTAIVQQCGPSLITTLLVSTESELGKTYFALIQTKSTRAIVIRNIT